MLIQIFKQSPLPFFAGFGLLLGIILEIFFPQTHSAHYIFMATLVICGMPLVLETFKKILQGKLSVDIIATLAILTAVVMNEAFTGAVVVLMQSGGEAMEKFGLRRAMYTLDALLSRAPKTAIRLKGGKQESIPVHAVAVGDQLLLRPGDLVPVDGTIVEGEGEIDDAAITGEPFVHFVKVNQTLLSGSVLVNGALTLRADKISSDSQYATIVKLVEKAQREKANIQRLADRYAIFFTPLTFLIAAMGYWITGDSTTILAVLVVATPCPLILATPIAVLSGINRAAKAGIIVKGGVPLEKIAQVDVVVFDKTGTLTEGVPQIDHIVPTPSHQTDDVLYYAGIIEQRSAHAIAVATTKAALSRFSELPQPSHLHETPGSGVSGDYQQNQITVGTINYIQSQLHGAKLSEFLHFIEPLAKENKLMSVVAVNQQAIGVIFFEDKLRPDAKGLIQELKTLGIKVIIMLTGDREENAKRIASELGITHYHANLHPEDKVNEIVSIAKQHPYTLMVGDGINDAPALASAYVGLAMGARGVAISAQAADIVLLEDNIGYVAHAIAIGKRMLHIAKQGIWIGMGLSVLLMFIAAFGYIPPAIGAVLQEVIDVAVILNALRARK